MMRSTIVMLLLASACERGGAGRVSDPATCGDGVLDEGEECDLGVFNADTGLCKTDCMSARCGDGITGPGEACDDGNAIEDDDCTSLCEVPVLCPNGRLDLGEECDDGNADDFDDCLSTCVLARCGDGVVRLDVLDPGEIGFELCDAGVHNSDFASDACRSTCELAYCGDGVVDDGEECDDGDENSDTEPDTCRTACVSAYCGDDVIDDEEACDDGSLNSDVEADACRTDCQAAHCSDGVVDDGEDCDTGGDSATCDADCTVPVCGDGHVNELVDEDCDDAGESISCDLDCTPRACGDGVVNVTADEACDVGSVITNGSCTLSCQIVCQTNFGDCTDTPGCETELQTDELHCGRCDHDCGGGACGLGVCQPVKIADLGTMSYLRLYGMRIANGYVWNLTDAGLARVPADASELFEPVIYSGIKSAFRGYAIVDDEIWFFPWGAGGLPMKLHLAPINDAQAAPTEISDAVPWATNIEVFGDSIFAVGFSGAPSKPFVIAVPLDDVDDFTRADMDFEGIPLYGLVVDGSLIYFTVAGDNGNELWRVFADLSDPQPVLVAGLDAAGGFIAQSDDALFSSITGSIERAIKDPFECMPEPVCESSSYVTTSGGVSPIDIDGTYLYWVDKPQHAIRRKDLETGAVQDVLIDTLRNPVNIAVGENFIYWLEWVTANGLSGQGTLWKVAK